jgi:hypothetical protein
MDKGRYELEVANRKMNEFQQQAERDAMVKELKESRKAQRPSLWSRIFGQRQPASENHRPGASFKSVYGASKDD